MADLVRFRKSNAGIHERTNRSEFQKGDEIIHERPNRFKFWKRNVEIHGYGVSYGVVNEYESKHIIG